MSIKDKYRNRRLSLTPIQLVDDTVFIRPLKLGEIKRMNFDVAKPYDSNAALLAASLCDANGNRIYEDDETDLILDSFLPEEVTPIVKKIHELNGMTKEAVEDAKKN